MSYFPEVVKPIAYEGPDSKNPLAYKFYNPDEIVAGKTMRDHLRFAVAYWHTYCGVGSDVFGAGTYSRPWDHSDPIKHAEAKLAANFEFCQKLDVDYYCFHDRDIAPEGATFSESVANLEHVISLAEKYQADTGVKLLWGTANLFSNPRYMHGAGTNPDAHVAAYAAAQIKHVMEATHRLGGENYVFWGGREGYETLLNTDMKQEEEQFAAFLKMCVEHKKKIGFTGTFLIEPKPCEPTKHQYDHDSATVISFLRKYDLLDEFKLNIEANHATLAGHTFHHELAVASNAGLLGSVDANRGDELLGWDTDQFPTNIYETAYAMLVILQQGGLGSGGLNFDAKLRRGSIDAIDLFHAHVGAMDAFARGLIIAQRMLDDGIITTNVAERYASWNDDIGAKILSGNASLDECNAWILNAGEPSPKSGRQEYLENIVNSYL